MKINSFSFFFFFAVMSYPIFLSYIPQNQNVKVFRYYYHLFPTFYVLLIKILVILKNLSSLLINYERNRRKTRMKRNGGGRRRKIIGKTSFCTLTLYSSYTMLSRFLGGGDEGQEKLWGL